MLKSCFPKDVLCELIDKYQRTKISESGNLARSRRKAAEIGGLRRKFSECTLAEILVLIFGRECVI